MSEPQVFSHPEIKDRFFTFPKGQMPPVNPMAFWSITMYTNDGSWEPPLVVRAQQSLARSSPQVQ